MHFYPALLFFGTSIAACSDAHYIGARMYYLVKWSVMYGISVDVLHLKISLPSRSADSSTKKSPVLWLGNHTFLSLQMLVILPNIPVLWNIHCILLLRLGTLGKQPSGKKLESFSFIHGISLHYGDPCNS